MTQDSRAAFEVWAKKLYDPQNEHPELLDMTSKDERIKADLLPWQASEQRILDLLGSDEMVEVVTQALNELWVEGCTVTMSQSAKAALAAIKQKINLTTKGE